MSRAERLAAVFTAAYAATRWAQESPRVKVAVTALRGGMVVYRARIERGTLVIRNHRRGVVAESTFIGFPHVDLTCPECDGEMILPCDCGDCGLYQECHVCEGTGRRSPTLAEWDERCGSAVQVGGAR